MSIHDGELIRLAERAERVFGPDDTLRAGGEEPGELSVACQHLRRPERRDDPEYLLAVAEEIADVEIVLRRLHRLFADDVGFALLHRVRREKREKFERIIELAEKMAFDDRRRREAQS